MKVAACIVIASIFVNTVKALKSKQVNLALETVLNFDKKDRAADLAVIDKVQDFLEQIKNAMRKGTARRSTKHEITFTDFILEAARILRDYDDNDLEDAYVIINDESRRYINKESEFQDLFGSNDMRRFVSNQLDDAKEMPASALRQNLDSAINIIESHKRAREKNNLLDIGNTLYEGASDKFMVALRNLDNLRRAGEINLERVLKDTLRSLVFEHYANLNSRVRDELINMVKHYWRAFADIKNGEHERSKPKTVDVTRFRHEGKGKRLKHKASTPRERTHSSKVKPYDIHLKDKSDASYETYNNKDKNRHEVFVTEHKLKELIRSPDKTEKKKSKSRFSVYRDDDKPYRNSEVKKTVRNKHKRGEVTYLPPLLRGPGNKYDRTEDRTRGKSDLSESNEPGVLMGGQIVRDVHFRGESSSKEESGDSDRAEDVTSTEEILIQHSNIVDIGLSRKTPGRINITFVSSEIRSDRSKENGSSESVSIENKVRRKSNVNDTLEIPNPKEPLNVDVLIQKIEKEIEDVRDQVEYIKNLTKIKSSDNNEIALNGAIKNLTVSETPKKDNGFSFRTQDSDIFSSSEIENDSKKNITETTTAVPAISEMNPDAVKNVSDSINVNSNTNIDKSTEQETADSSQNHDTDKSNTLKDAPSAPNDVNVNENDKGGPKTEDNEEDNAITESNANSTTSLVVDIKLDA